MRACHGAGRIAGGHGRAATRRAVSPGCLAGLIVGLIGLAVAAVYALLRALEALVRWVAWANFRAAQRRGSVPPHVTEPPMSSWLVGWGAGIGAIIVLVAALGSVAALSSAHGGNTTGNYYTATSYVAAATNTPTATDTPSPTPTATATPTPTATPIPLYCDSSGVPCNPWGYTFNDTGKPVYNPPHNICVYFHPCIGNFWNGTGYVVECADSMYSQSGGNSGACSSHGGEWRPVYQP